MQNLEIVIDRIKKNSDGKNLLKINLTEDYRVEIYSNSINEHERSLFFIARENDNKYLYIIHDENKKTIAEKFQGEVINTNIKKCPLVHRNVKALQSIFDFTLPKPIGLTNSFGFGDRLGLANPAHVRALNDFNKKSNNKFKPIFAQQSIRELNRTDRTPQDVIDASVWAVFQERYKDGFGADADHLKTNADIDLTAKAGFKTFTFDPSDFVLDGVENLNEVKINKLISELPVNEFEDSIQNIISRYENKKIEINKNFMLQPSAVEIKKAILKYIRALNYLKKMYDHLMKNYPGKDYEVEISIDETDTVTSAFEHFFVVNELLKLKISFISLAPRFIGGFEKGIDYKGDIEIFKKEYLKHVMIAEHFGFYKLSFHSGSDKFKVYEAAASIKKSYIHIKTAGTSYLEALKVTAAADPDLFKEILEFSIKIFETEKETYYVSASVENIKNLNQYTNQEIKDLFKLNDARQILHVAYGKVLTAKNGTEYLFRNRIYDCLKKNEELHYKYLIEHFHKHLRFFY